MSIQTKLNQYFSISGQTNPARAQILFFASSDSHLLRDTKSEIVDTYIAEDSPILIQHLPAGKYITTPQEKDFFPLVTKKNYQIIGCDKTNVEPELLRLTADISTYRQKLLRTLSPLSSFSESKQAFSPYETLSLEKIWKLVQKAFNEIPANLTQMIDGRKVDVRKELGNIVNTLLTLKEEEKKLFQRVSTLQKERADLLEKTLSEVLCKMPDKKVVVIADPKCIEAVLEKFQTRSYTVLTPKDHGIKGNLETRILSKL